MPRGYRWRKGGGKRGRGRPRFYRKLSKIPKAKGYIPLDPEISHFPISKENTVFLDLDELEAMRLVDGENLTQDEAGFQIRPDSCSFPRLCPCA